MEGISVPVLLLFLEGIPFFYLFFVGLFFSFLSCRPRSELLPPQIITQDKRTPKTGRIKT
jgi:hypothetical protein